eukprot:scaffold219853_cov33-Tisochrysis_lutea.AAC.1
MIASESVIPRQKYIGTLSSRPAPMQPGTTLQQYEPAPIRTRRRVQLKKRRPKEHGDERRRAPLEQRAEAERKPSRGEKAKLIERRVERPTSEHGDGRLVWLRLGRLTPVHPSLAASMCGRLVEQPAFHRTTRRDDTACNARSRQTAALQYGSLWTESQPNR